MKCPKCGYNSFESLDICKKCSGDLSSFKQTHGITAIIMPLEVREKLAAELQAASAEVEQHTENVETHEDMFAFDLPDEASAPAEDAAPYNNDPFNFDEEPVASEISQPKAEDDPFADLLETTPQVSNDPFSAPQAAPSAPKVSAPSADGEFDLENFSWDDTPVDTASSAGAEAPDDFDSLFGDSDEKK
jgi:hypothetical protein